MSLAPATPSTSRKGGSSLRTPRTTSSSLPPIPGPSPAYVGGSRSRHGVYGVDDRVVLDLGSRVWKAGFSSESKPRVVGTVSELCGGNDDALRRLHGEEALVGVSEDEQERRETVLRERIVDGLRTIFFQHLMVDPKQRKVIVLEGALVPHSYKAAIATALFDNLGVPSASFCSSPLLTLMACGTITGLVVDVGHLETCITPVFASRPLFPFVCSTPRAGAQVTEMLRALLLRFARYQSTQSLATGPPAAGAPRPQGSTVPSELLTVETIEDIKTRLCFVSEASLGGPVLQQSAAEMSAEHISLSLLEARYASPSTSASTVYPLSSVPSPINAPLGTLPKGSILVPGWIRERAAELLFDAPFSEDETDCIPAAILHTIERLPMDLRRAMASSIVVAGGGAMLPGFVPRLRRELGDLLVKGGATGDGDSRTRRRRKLPFATIAGLGPHVAILNDPGAPWLDVASRSGSAPSYAPSLLAWIGGSLTGSIKTGGAEVARERWDAIVEQEVINGLAARASQEAESEMGECEPRPADPTEGMNEEDEERLREWLKQKRGIRKACGLVPDWTRLSVPVS